MKVLEDYKFMCPEPFTNVFIGSNFTYAPCCVMSYPGLEENLKGFFTPDFILRKKMNNTTFIEFYNSPPMVRLRNAMRNDNDREYIEVVCKNCIHKENAGTQSFRQFYLRRFDFEFKEYKEELEKIIAQDLPPTFFHSIELEPIVGNYCNLSCNMCDGSNSSSYKQEQIELGEIDKNSKILHKLDFEQKNYKDLETILDKILELKLVGGEPLISKDTFKLMESIPNPERTILRIITNATVVPDIFLSIAKKFKDVIINVSVEGYGEVNDYIRFPSKWLEIMENVRKLEAIGQVYLVTTVNAINIGRLHELDNMNYKVTNSSLVMSNFYSLNSIPPDIKDLYLNTLYKHKKKNCIRYLENSQYDEKSMWDMLGHIKRRDKKRKTNLLTICPEWKYYYENCSS